MQSKTITNKTNKNLNFGCTEAIIPFTDVMGYKKIVILFLIEQFMWQLYTIMVQSEEYA